MCHARGGGVGCCSPPEVVDGAEYVGWVLVKCAARISRIRRGGRVEDSGLSWRVETYD